MENHELDAIVTAAQARQRYVLWLADQLFPPAELDKPIVDLTADALIRMRAAEELRQLVGG